MSPSPAAHSVAVALKHRGLATTAELATDLGLSYETVRAHVAALADQGMVEPVRSPSAGAGRPVTRWRLTIDGEHLFPKQYSELASSLLDVLSEAPSNEGPSDAGPSVGMPSGRARGPSLNQTLAGLVDQKVAAWIPALEGADHDQRLIELTSIYAPEDPYCTVERDDRGPVIIERNCPYLNVARHHPALCGLTLNTLSRLLGRRVVREATFQAGDGRCVFRVTDEEVHGPDYVPEQAPFSGDGGG
jgi:predicted ArsR family transcriptional regulator